MKKLKLRNEVKIIMLGVATITMLVLMYTTLNNASEKALQQQANEYKTCIELQSKDHSYIIRSACSTNYRQLDEVANIEYKQVGYDLYLVD